MTRAKTKRTFAGGRGTLIKDVGEPEWVAYYGDKTLGYLTRNPSGSWSCYRKTEDGPLMFFGRGPRMEALANAAWALS